MLAWSDPRPSGRGPFACRVAASSNHSVNSERETRAVGALTYFIIQRAYANASVVSRQVTQNVICEWMI